MPEPSDSETLPSRSISRRTWRRIGAVFAILILVLVVHLHRRWHAVARLQYSLDRNYEVDFNEVQRPRSMPEFLDLWTLEILKGLEKRGLLGPSNNRTALHTRVFTLFHGTIRSIEIYYPEKTSRDFGPALEQFSGLEYLLIDDPGFDADTYRDGTTLILNSLSNLNHLKKLDLGCFHLGEGHLEQIAELPNLEILILGKAMVPANFIEIVSRSATLKELHTDVSVPVLAEIGNGKPSDPFSSGGASSDAPADPFSSGAAAPQDPLQSKVDPPDPFASHAGSTVAPADPFSPNPAPPDPFQSKTTKWKSSESERQLLDRAGIKLIE